MSCEEAAKTISIPYKQVEKILVYNRGRFSTYHSRVISNRDSIKEVCELLNKTKLVRTDTIILKQTERAAIIHIYESGGEEISIYCAVTSQNGTIFDHKGSMYQEYKLYDYLK